MKIDFASWPTEWVIAFEDIQSGSNSAAKQFLLQLITLNQRKWSDVVFDSLSSLRFLHSYSFIKLFTLPSIKFIL